MRDSEPALASLGAPNTVADPIARSPEIPPHSARVQLGAGWALSAERASTITMRRRTRVVVVAGMPRSGKTTLIAGLYGRFLIGPFAGYSFKWSDTLVAFEDISHLARNASRGQFADTTRTKSAPTYLHLELVNELGHAEDLLYADYWGETFKLFRSDATMADQLSVISRADHFILLVDGDKLTGPERHSAARDASTIFRRVSEAALLSAAQRVDVVVSKWDRVEKALKDVVLRDERLHAVRSIFDPLLQSVTDGRFSTLSVRDDDGTPTQDSTSLAQLLNRSIEPTIRAEISTIVQYSTPVSTSPYLNFGREL